MKKEVKECIEDNNICPRCNSREVVYEDYNGDFWFINFDCLNCYYSWVDEFSSDKKEKLKNDN